MPTTQIVKVSQFSRWMRTGRDSLQIIRMFFFEPFKIGAALFIKMDACLLGSSFHDKHICICQQETIVRLFQEFRNSGFIR